MNEKPLNNDGSQHCIGCDFIECLPGCACHGCVGYGIYYCPTSNCAYDIEMEDN